MYRVRLWSTRRARLLERFYNSFERLLVKCHPVFNRIGYQRLDKPVAFVEKVVKGMLFDCQMCGQCVLSSTGMTCPMNCPKQLRNGPCGGVTAAGFCEVNNDMRCVWVEAAAGAQRMHASASIHTVQSPVDQRLKGHSAWLRAVQEKCIVESQPPDQQTTISP